MPCAKRSGRSDQQVPVGCVGQKAHFHQHGGHGGSAQHVQAGILDNAAVGQAGLLIQPIEYINGEIVCGTGRVIRISLAAAGPGDS